MNSWISELFATIDQMDSEKFVTYLTENAKFTFGNAPTVTGQRNIKKTVADFFVTIRALKHNLVKTWEIGDSIFCEIRVTYTRRDGKEIILPGVNLFTMNGNKISDYKIFIDISPLYS